jgi:hypothetical protein
MRHAVKTSLIASVGDRHPQIIDTMAKAVLHLGSYSTARTCATCHGKGVQELQEFKSCRMGTSEFGEGFLVSLPLRAA